MHGGVDSVPVHCLPLKKLVPVQVGRLCRCVWRMLGQFQLAAIVNLSSPSQ